MALPTGRLPHTDDKTPKRPSAPRMDLVGLEPAGDRWRIVFWEAKLVTNPSARCEPGKVPKVVGQLGKYTNWLKENDNCGQVAKAYRYSCRFLVDLHAIARCCRSDIEELGLGIRAVAATGAPLPLIDDKPRLLIDACSGKDTSFTKKGHLKDLSKRFGLHVQMVEGEDQMILWDCA